MEILKKFLALYHTFSPVLCQVPVRIPCRVVLRILPEVSANLPAHSVALLKSPALGPTFSNIKKNQHHILKTEIVGEASLRVVVA